MILNYFYLFYIKKHEKDILELVEIFEKLGTINMFKNKELNERIYFYENNYLQKAQERIKMSNSILFKYFYVKETINNKNDEEKQLNESIKKFQNMKNILKENIDIIDENLINIFINIFRNKEDKAIREEIITLIDIFKIKDFKKDGLIVNLILLLKKIIFQKYQTH